MLDNVKKHGCAPEDIYNEKNEMADDGTLTKILFFDIARQTRLVVGQSSVDTEQLLQQCSSADSVTSVSSFGLPKATVQSMLETIKEM